MPQCRFIKIITCSCCGRPVGSLEKNAAGQPVLMVGGLPIESFHGWCTCGNTLHWAPPREEKLAGMAK